MLDPLATTTAGGKPFSIRWMIRRDMDEVQAIEEDVFEFPWDEDTFIRTLRQRNCIAMAAKAEERVLAYMVYELRPKRLDLLNLAVMGEVQNMGVGRAMIERLMSKLSPQRRTAISLEVRETNLPAQRFFKRIGFRAVKVLHGEYDDTDEDMYRMELKLSEVKSDQHSAVSSQKKH